MDKIAKAIEIIKQAGKIALQEQTHLTRETKADTSLVTSGDLAVSQFLEKELAAIFPDHDIFSEENSKVIPTKNKVLVIDPIDGTESYSRGEDTWSILVGFWEQGEAVGGIIYQPTLKRLYQGFKGQGSYQIDEDLTITKLEALAEGELTALTSPKNYGEGALLQKLGINKVTPMYSAALKIMEVSKGSSDAYPNFRRACSIWDLIAPMAILKEAGGSIYFETAKQPSFNQPLWDVNFCAIGKRIPVKEFVNWFQPK